MNNQRMAMLAVGLVSLAAPLAAQGRGSASRWRDSSATAVVARAMSPQSVSRTVLTDLLRRFDGRSAPAFESQLIAAAQAEAMRTRGEPAFWLVLALGNGGSRFVVRGDPNRSVLPALEHIARTHPEGGIAQTALQELANQVEWERSLGTIRHLALRPSTSSTAISILDLAWRDPRHPIALRQRALGHLREVWERRGEVVGHLSLQTLQLLAQENGWR